MYKDLRFKAKIANQYDLKKEPVVELDASQFYPDGLGGQLGDRGEINAISVLEVKKSREGKIIHVMETEPEAGIGTEVECRISGRRRNEIARQHTAQHLISANFENSYGIHTAGFHMSSGHTTIDLDSTDIDAEMIEQIERDLFEQIIDLIDVEILEISPDELHKYPLRKKVSGKLLKLNKLRLVRIGELDYSLCKGFHTDNTGNIGMIKVYKMEKVKSEYTRIYYVAGLRAMDDYQRNHRILKETSDFLSTSPEELQMRLKNLIDENKSVTKTSKKLSESLAKEMYTNLSSRKDETGRRRIVEVLPSEESAKGLSKEIMKEPDTIAVFLFERSKNTGFNIVSTHDDINARDILNRLNENLSIKGGGSETMALGTVHGNLDQIKHDVEMVLEEY